MEQTELTAHLEATCAALLPPGQVTEIRVLGLKGHRDFPFNAAGWFDDIEKAVEAIEHYDRRAPEGIYLIPNKLHPGCLARANNRMVERKLTATADNDIERRHWLYIDCDPTRPARIASTQAELDHAFNQAKAIVKYLEKGCGWPSGYRACSGNGIHLFYRVDLPNDDKTKALLRDVLLGLAKEFDSRKCVIDTTMFNAARIVKMAGTVARKGDGTTDRPHRRSNMLPRQGVFQKFDETEIVSAEQLEAIAAIGRLASAPAATTKRRKPKGRVLAKPDASGHFFDIEAFIAEHAIGVKETKHFDGGTKYILDHCPFDVSHDGSSATLGRTRNGALFFKCQHNSCANQEWRDVRRLFDPAAKSVDEGRKKIEDKKKGDADDQWELARIMLDEEFSDADTGEILLRRHRQQFLLYSTKQKRYRTLSNDAMQVAVTRWIGKVVDKASRRLIGDVINCVEAMVTIDDEPELPVMSKVDLESGAATVQDGKRNMVTLKNGILDVDNVIAGEPFDECLRTHTPNWVSTVSLDFTFPTTAPEQECPRWMKFLDEIFEGDVSRMMVLQEFFGYCFLPSQRYERFMVMYGGGRNGKSTALNVLCALLNEQCVSSLTLGQMQDPKMCYALYGKVANICGDMSDMDRVEESMLKAIVSGDLVQVDRKYRDPMQFRPTAKLLFSTNTLPRFTDVTQGLWRRLIVLPFTYTVPAAQVDNHLMQKLRKELPAILIWALEGLARLVENNGFSESKKCSDELSRYKLQCLPILTFLDECTIPDGEVTVSELWNAYRIWTKLVGLTRPKPAHPFIRDVVSLRKIQYERPKRGVALRTTLYGVSLKLGWSDGMGSQSPLPTASPEERITGT